MNIVISRILTYLNGTLMFDEYYRFCLFVVYQYRNFEEVQIEDIVRSQNISEESIVEFCKLLGFDTFEQFKQTLLQDFALRSDQIHARMLGVSSEEITDTMQTSLSTSQLQNFVSDICKEIHRCKRILLIGPLYPISIAVELQTDFITFGKPVIQYHHFDKEVRATKEDFIIYISATGRSLVDFKVINQQIDAQQATSLLLTQNKLFTETNITFSTYVLHIPGKYDGIHFYHQVMFLFDAIRIHYYQQYYI